MTEAQELTAPFWEAAGQGRLVRPVCDACGRSFFTPQAACPHCGSEAWRYAASGGAGVVYSYTVVHRGPDPRFEPPYVLAVVDIVDEGWTLMTNIVDVPADRVEIGMPVTVRWLEREGRALPAFAPAQDGRS